MIQLDATPIYNKMVQTKYSKQQPSSPPSSPSERARKQVCIILSVALSLFLCSTFILVEMLPSPTDETYTVDSMIVGVDNYSVVGSVNQHSEGRGGSAITNIHENSVVEQRSHPNNLRHNYHDRLTQQEKQNKKSKQPMPMPDEAAQIDSQEDNNEGNDDDDDDDTQYEKDTLEYKTEIAVQKQPLLTNKNIINEAEPRLIHILETRFMQNQPTLIELAKARLHLLKTICLPTVIHQSSWGDFLWIIRTDPELDDIIKHELVNMLKDAGALTKMDENGKEHALTYVIGSNDNYIVSNSTTLSPMVRPFDIRSMLSHALSQPQYIFAGKSSSMQMLLDEISLDRIGNDVIMWTRLDADDGLNVHYMEYIQTQTVRYFLPDRFDREILDMIPETKDDDDDEEGKGKDTEKSESRPKLVRNDFTPPQWTYWCAGRNIDWFLTDPIHDPHHKNGTVYPVIHANVCVTPGVTVALSGSFDPNQVPRLDHDKIISYLRPKGGQLCSRSGYSVFNDTDADEDEKGDEEDDGSCFHMVTGGVSAIRSRTPTSAGMMGIKPDLNQLGLVEMNPKLPNMMWKSMVHEFRVENENLLTTNSYFAEHVYDIAEENARGQCTAGHSCKVCVLCLFFAVCYLCNLISHQFVLLLTKSSSKDLLQQYVDLRHEMGDGFDIFDGKIINSENDLTE